VPSKKNVGLKPSSKMYKYLTVAAGPRYNTPSCRKAGLLIPQESGILHLGERTGRLPDETDSLIARSNPPTVPTEESLLQSEESLSAGHIYGDIPAGAPQTGCTKKE
jgi:hypothetical protein